MKRAVPALVAAVLVVGASIVVPTLTADAATSDPLVARQWSLDAIRAEEAFALSRGAGVIVAVVDSGVDLDHPDLAANLLPGRTFLSCGSAGCGNGDWESGPPGAARTASDHGTHVAGIVGAVADNGRGIVGVAPDARILPIKALDLEGGNSTDVAHGIRWAVEQGADVINLSLGTAPTDDPGGAIALAGDVAQAVDFAITAGAVIVAAAGNDALPLCDDPAYNALVICVAATDKRGVRSTFSNAPVKPGQLAVSAPGGSAVAACGEDVLSTVPLLVPPQCNYGAGYAEMAGTSMATPHVAGQAALLVAQGRSRQNVIDAIITTARNPATGERGSYTPTYGYGIVDAQASLQRHGAVAAGAPPEDLVTRLAGSDRLETAIAISRAGYGSRPAAAVVLSRHDGFADALAGTPLAAAVDGPLLLTPPGALDPRTEEEIVRVLARGSTVHLLGGAAALSEAVATRIAALGYTTVRYGGSDRFDTATRIAELGLRGPTNVVLATGLRHEDALVGGAAAPAMQAAVLLTNGRTAHPMTAAYLLRHPGGRRVAVGADAAAAHPDAQPVAGRDAPATSRVVAETLVSESPYVVLASHVTFPDALAGGAYAALRRGPLLFVDPEALPPVVGEFIASRSTAIAGAAVLGGPAAVSESVQAEVSRAISD